MSTPVVPASPLTAITFSRFSDESIQAAIDMAAAELPSDKSGLVVHADGSGGITASIVQRFGAHVFVKAGAEWAGGKISGGAELVATW